MKVLFLDSSDKYRVTLEEYESEEDFNLCKFSDDDLFVKFVTEQEIIENNYVVY